MVNLNLYNVFCTVAEEKNISKASKKLFISQPALSFSIKELEKELGQDLFIRRSKGVELTAFGKILYSKVKPAIQNFEDVEKSAYRFGLMKEGAIRIGACSSNVNQILTDYLSTFVKKYPDVKVIMQRENNDRLINMLENNDLDVLFIDKSENLSEFEIVKTFDVRYQLIGNEKFKRAHMENKVSLDKFPTNELMLPSINNNSRIAINEFFDKANISLNPKYELDNYIMLYDFVKNGFGMAFVNIDYYKDAVKNGEVYVIYPDLSINARKFACVINKQNTNPAVGKLVEIIKEK